MKKQKMNAEQKETATRYFAQELEGEMQSVVLNDRSISNHSSQPTAYGVG